MTVTLQDGTEVPVELKKSAGAYARFQSLAGVHVRKHGLFKTAAEVQMVADQAAYWPPKASKPSLSSSMGALQGDVAQGMPQPMIAAA